MQKPWQKRVLIKKSVKTGAVEAECVWGTQEKTMEAINLKFISLGQVIIHRKHISAGSYVSEVLLGYRKTLYVKAHPILKL